MRARCLLNWPILSILALSCPAWSPAQTGPTAIVTVDVESLPDVPLPDQIDPVCSDGSHCGLMHIAQMLEERGLRGTFFLNVYEYKSWGASTLRNIAIQLRDRGHDVALHTHPQWAYDPARPNMYDYSVQDQTAIVRDGVRLLMEWTGLPVVAYRAGAYSSNIDSMRALETNGIRFDSSWFLEHANSRLTELKLPSNLPSRYGKIEEIPISVYERRELPRGLSGFAPALSSIRKLDPNWFFDEREAIGALDAVAGTDSPYLVLFLHSFSFISGPGAQGKLIPDAHSQQVFAAMLDHLAQRKLPFSTFRDLAAKDIPLKQSAQDRVPGVMVEVAPYKYLAHLIHRKPFVALGIPGIFAALLAGYLLLRRRRAQRS